MTRGLYRKHARHFRHNPVPVLAIGLFTVSEKPQKSLGFPTLLISGSGSTRTAICANADFVGIQCAILWLYLLPDVCPTT